ncbi:MAG: AraC family transcriptional regulator [Victivallales bacterium]
MKSYACSPSPLERQMGIWVMVSGHYNTNEHFMKSRNFDQSLLIYCLDGAGTYTLGETTYEIRKGDIFYVPAHFTHRYASDPVAGWNIKWLHFCGSYAENLVHIAGFSALQPVRKIGASKPVSKGFDSLFRVLSDKRINYSLDAARVFMGILIELIKVSGPRNSKKDLTETISTESVDLASAAKKSGYSKFHFSRLFKKSTGVSPWTYALGLKIDRAKEMLMNSDVSVKEVSLTVGIGDPNYFSRLFAKHTGMPPVRYRKLMSER